MAAFERGVETPHWMRCRDASELWITIGRERSQGHSLEEVTYVNFYSLTKRPPKLRIAIRVNKEGWTLTYVTTNHEVLFPNLTYPASSFRDLRNSPDLVCKILFPDPHKGYCCGNKKNRPHNCLILYTHTEEDYPLLFTLKVKENWHLNFPHQPLRG